MARTYAKMIVRSSLPVRLPRLSSIWDDVPMRRSTRTKLLLIRRLVTRDGYLVCHYCRWPLRLAHPEPLTCIHIEHVRPRSRGGTDVLANLVLSCETCNYRKGTLDYETFLCESRLA